MSKYGFIISIICIILFQSCEKDNNDPFEHNTGWEIKEAPVLSAMTTPEWMKWQTDPCVLKVNDQWLMYFGCNNKGVKTQIGMATSTDGINWTPYTTSPVLEVGDPGSWDDTDVETPWVVYDEAAPAGQRYKMWYAGNGKAGPNCPDFVYQVGYAFSADGIHWTKYNDPSNDTDARYSESDPVLPIPSFMDDGSGNLIPDDLTSPADAWTTGEPSVIIESDGTYRLYYIGLGLDTETRTIYQHRVLMAESDNGYNWTKKGVVFEANHSDVERIGIMCPAVIKQNNEYLLFYTMLNLDFDQFANIEQGVTGYATSIDGVRFTRYSSNPIIDHGPAGSYHMSGAFAATPVIESGQLWVYFGGLHYTELPPLFEPAIGLAQQIN